MIGRNNPFNIRFTKANKWIGQTGETRGFCDFDTIEHGVRAAAYLLMISYRKQEIYTYAGVINKFAPPSENDSARYVEFVCGCLHVMPWDKIKTLANYCGLMHYMWIMENGNSKPRPYPASWIKDIIVKFKLKPYEVNKK